MPDWLPFRSVLVTGGGGFVGQYLIAAVREHLVPDARLVAPGRFGRSGERLDLNDASAVMQLVADLRPDLVMHLAAQSSVGGSIRSAADTWQTNVSGTLNLARAVADGVPTATLAFVSSSEVYGAAFNAGPAIENTTPQPMSPYARTKRAAEDLLGDVLTPTNRLLVFRPGNHSGPGQDTRFVLPAFANQIARIEAGKMPPIVKVGSLTAVRDFLDVRDVVAAYCAVLCQDGLEMREVFNIGSGDARPISALLETLLEMTGVSIRVEQDPARLRPSDVPCAQIDATKLRRRTGWFPRYAMRDTIAAVLDDCRHRQNPDWPKELG